MSFRIPIAVAAAIACAPALAQQSTVEPAKSTTAAQDAAARYSPERLTAIRQALDSRIAVYDAGEQAMRRPTAAEAAALAPAAAAAASEARIVTLPGGGAALRVEASTLEYLIVDIGTDGRKSIRHGQAASVGSKASASKEGHRHAQ